MLSEDFVYTQLVDGLRLQAAPFELQRRTLPEFVHLPDEVLNAVFPDYFPQLFKRGLIPQSAGPAVDSYLTYLNGFRPYGSDDAALLELETGHWFQGLRAQATSVLTAIGQCPSAPTLAGTHYIPGA